MPVTTKTHRRINIAYLHIVQFKCRVSAARDESELFAVPRPVIFINLAAAAAVAAAATTSLRRAACVFRARLTDIRQVLI